MGRETISAASMRIIRLLAGQPPMTVDELADATNVTRNAVSEQLNELLAAGYVHRAPGPSVGRGRPKNLYSATNESLKDLFSGNQSLLVPAMQQAVSEIGGPSLLADVAERVSRILADYYKARIRSQAPLDRLRELQELMVMDGVIVEVEEDGDDVILRKRSCPFISMHDSSHFVCDVDAKMISDVIGRPVQQRESRHGENACCSFVLSLNNGK